MKIVCSKEAGHLNKWDDFVKENDIGSHLLLSDWLSSYSSYGFDYEVSFILEKDSIIGGFGAVIAKVGFLKFFIVPFGPIVVNDRTDVLKELLDFIPQQAEKIGACYCQINFPLSDGAFVSNHCYSAVAVDLFTDFEKGHLFKYVYSTNGLNWIDLKKFTSTEEILQHFSSSVRRDIRSSERKGLELRYLVKESEIKEGYLLCVENAKKGNYAIRRWEDFKSTLLCLVQKDLAKFIACYQDDQIKGALLLVKSGNYYTYILGGTKREKPDILAGHFLQWEAIQLSFREGLDGYNISLGGSKGVQQFKNSFNNQALFFNNGKYYRVVKPILFQFFIIFERLFQFNKEKITKFISIFK